MSPRVVSAFLGASRAGVYGSSASFFVSDAVRPGGTERSALRDARIKPLDIAVLL